MFIQIPKLLRIKKNVLSRLGVYLQRDSWDNIALYYGEGIENIYGELINKTLHDHKILTLHKKEILSNAVENIFDDLAQIPQKTEVLIAVGGGKVVDYCKYLGFLKKLPVIAVPTALSNDGMASPNASLTQNNKRKSFKAAPPEGILIDTEIILKSPIRYTYSGIGDMVAKITAIHDWKLAFHKNKELVNDFSVEMARQSVTNVLSSSSFNPLDLEFISKLAGSLVMSGVAMEVCGSSRPASGSEHLISHAYDELSSAPSLHGIQVGVAAYLCSWLQKNEEHEKLVGFLLNSGFSNFVEKNPLSKKDFLRALSYAPNIKENYYTILTEENGHEQSLHFIENDPLIKKWLI